MVVRRSNEQIARAAVRQAKAEHPRAGRWKIFGLAKAQIRRENEGSSFVLILSILWQLFRFFK